MIACRYLHDVICYEHRHVVICLSFYDESLRHLSPRRQSVVYNISSLVLHNQLKKYKETKADKISHTSSAILTLRLYIAYQIVSFETTWDISDSMNILFWGMTPLVIFLYNHDSFPSERYGNWCNNHNKTKLGAYSVGYTTNTWYRHTPYRQLWDI